MRAFSQRIYLKIYAKPLWFSSLLFILLLRIAPVIPAVLYALIFDFTEDELSYDYSESLLRNVILIGTITLIIETLLCQTFLIWLFHKVCRFNYFVTVLLSGLVFGTLHAIHSVLYALCAVMVGFIFAFAYVLYMKKYTPTRAFWLVAGIHSLHNISAFAIHWLGIDL
jgi:hypothetical protein